MVVLWVFLVGGTAFLSSWYWAGLALGDSRPTVYILGIASVDDTEYPPRGESHERVSSSDRNGSRSLSRAGSSARTARCASMSNASGAMVSTSDEASLIAAVRLNALQVAIMRARRAVAETALPADCGPRRRSAAVCRHSGIPGHFYG